MRIGIVLPYLKSRGTENQALGLAVGFLNRGDSVTVFVVQGWGKPEVYKRFSRSGVDVVNVGSPIDVSKKQVRLFRLISLAGLARKHKCDVLFSRAGMTNRVTGLAGRLSRIPVVVSVSGSIPPVLKVNDRPLRKALSYLNTLRWKRHLGYPTRIICVSSEGTVNLAARHPSARNLITSVRNGIDANRVRRLAEENNETDLPTGRFLIAFNGSVEINRKGLDTLIDAMALVSRTESRPAPLAVVLGSGEDEDTVKKRVSRLGLAEYFLFVGETENPHTYVAQCDLFVLPSRREGLPNALLEAMALGVCSVAADCDTGPREIINHEETGFLFPVGDSEALSRLILSLKSDTALRSQVAEKGKKAVSAHFCNAKMIDHYYALLRQTARKSL